MRYFCGWDGGGSKTEVLCADINGREVARQTFGTLNLNGAPQEKVAETIANAVSFMKSIGSLDDCLALVIGSAGVSNVHVRTFITEHVRKRGFSGRLQIVGDHEIALEGLISGPGAVLIAGTGSVCIGKDDHGNRARAGGFGYLIDDCGSGYAIGRDILASIVRAHDGRSPQTCLTGMVLDQLHLPDIPGIVTWLYDARTEKKDVAALAPLLNHALAANDAAARQIAHTAAKDLSDLAAAVWKKLNLERGQLALTGSILEYFSAVREEVIRLSREAFPEMEIVSSQNGACEGALKLAMMMYPQK